MSVLAARRLLVASCRIPSLNPSSFALAGRNLAPSAKFLRLVPGSVCHAKNISSIPKRQISTAFEAAEQQPDYSYEELLTGQGDAFEPERPSFNVVETELEEPVSIFDPLDTFQRRHIGPTKRETRAMLDFLKYETLDAFVNDVLPPNILSPRELKVEPRNGLSETQLLARLKTIANKNKVLRSYIGTGYYGTKTPAVISRNILESPEWYTSYTPYQPEISQGELLVAL